MEAADGADFAAAVEGQLRPGTKSVTIDLEKVDSLSLGAIRAILRLARSLKGADRDMDFVRGSVGVRHALEQAGMADIFPFTPTLHSNRGHHHETS